MYARVNAPFSCVSFFFFCIECTGVIVVESLNSIAIVALGAICDTTVPVIQDELHVNVFLERERMQLEIFLIWSVFHRRNLVVAALAY